MIKALLSGAAAVALLTSSAAAAPQAELPAWVVTPAADSCRTELELTGGSGKAVAVALVSNGEAVELVFSKPDTPERAFLPIRVDHKPYANLVLRQADGKTAAMLLSADSLAALKLGGALQIGWLSDEPVQTTLAGSLQGLADLRTCGAQVAQRFREQQAVRQKAQARAAAEARAQAVADEQLAAAKAQKAAAEAEAERSAAEAEQLRDEQAEAEDAHQRAAQQAQAESDPYARARGYPDDPRTDYDPQAYSPYDEPRGPYRGW